MEPTNIPTPPDALIFYQWLSGIAVTALVFLVGYGVKRFIDSVDTLVKEVKLIRENQINHDGRIAGLEAKVFTVSYDPEKQKGYVGNWEEREKI